MIKIGDFSIGKNSRPFIIAEMSGNHNQSLDRALKIVEAAAYSGVQMLKLHLKKYFLKNFYFLEVYN